MAINAIAGAFLGLVSGFVFGILIQWLTGLVIDPTFSSDGPQALAVFFGMAVGTFVGACMGGIVGLDRGSKK